MSDEVAKPAKPLTQIFHRERVEYWALVAEIVAAFAVVLSLVFVGLQVRASNFISAREELNSSLEQSSSVRRSIYQDRSTALLFVSGMAAPQDLDRADRLRFKYLMDEQSWSIFALWIRHQESEPDYPLSALNDLAGFMCTPGGLAYWNNARHELDPNYAAAVEEIAVALTLADGAPCDLSTTTVPLMQIPHRTELPPVE